MKSKIKIVVNICSVVILFLGCQNNENILLEVAIQDLANIETYGYRSPILDVNTQASLKSTRGSFDLAITGVGFFKFHDRENDRFLYSRNGSLRGNENGELVNFDGYILQPKIQLSDYSLINNSNNKDGLNFISRNVKIYNASNGQIVREGNYFHIENTIEVKDSHVLQGFLELSNIDPLDALLTIERILKSEKEKNMNTNLDFKVSLINELRARYLQIQYDSKLGLYPTIEAFEKELEFFTFWKINILNRSKFR